MTSRDILPAGVKDKTAAIESIMQRLIDAPYDVDADTHLITLRGTVTSYDDLAVYKNGATGYRLRGSFGWWNCYRGAKNFKFDDDFTFFVWLREFLEEHL